MEKMGQNEMMELATKYGYAIEVKYKFNAWCKGQQFSDKDIDDRIMFYTYYYAYKNGVRLQMCSTCEEVIEFIQGRERDEIVSKIKKDIYKVEVEILKLEGSLKYMDATYNGMKKLCGDKTAVEKMMGKKDSLLRNEEVEYMKCAEQFSELFESMSEKEISLTVLNFYKHKYKKSRMKYKELKQQRTELYDKIRQVKKR